MSSSIKKIISNQKNSVRSTGPNPESWPITSGNATKHGLFSKNLKIREEDREAFGLFCEKMFTEHVPQGPTEMVLVDHFIDQCWRLRDCLRIETDLFEWYRNYQGTKGDCGVAFANDARQSNSLTRLSRYAPIFERGLRKDLAELRKLQARRSRLSNTLQQSAQPADDGPPAQLPEQQDDKTHSPMPQARKQTYLVAQGILSKQVLLSDEDPSQFKIFVDDLFAEWKPRHSTQAFFVELLAVTSWRLARCSRVEAELFEQYRFYDKLEGGLLTAFVQDAAEMDCFPKLAEYESKLRNTFSRVLKELLS